MRASCIAAALVVLLCAPGSARALGATDINVSIVAPGQVNLGITWKWPPWGAQMRVEYGTTPSYGSVTPWIARADSPFEGRDTVTLTGLPPHVNYHYRVVVQPTGGPPGQDSSATADHLLSAVGTTNEVCAINCPPADNACKTGCATDPKYFDNALAACQAKCRADDPDCPGACHNSLSYVSMPPKIVLKGLAARCPAQWSVRYTDATVAPDCFPVDSDFCKGKLRWIASASLTCQRGNEFQTYSETLCATRRGVPQTAGGGRWITNVGESRSECTGSDPATDCQVRCPM